MMSLYKKKKKYPQLWNTLKHTPISCPECGGLSF